MKKNLKMLLLAAGFAFGTSAAEAGTVHIQPKAIIPPHQDVHLGDIATISDADPKTAETLAGTVILSNISAGRTIKTEAILMAVISQQGPDISNHLQVSGSSECEIIVGTGTLTSSTEAQFESDSRAMAMTPTRIDTPLPALTAQPSVIRTLHSTPIVETPVLTASVITTPPPEATKTPDTLAKLITAKVSQDLQTPETDLRITFDTIDPALDTPATAGRVWRFRPLSHPLLGNVQFEANLVESNHAIKKLMVTAHVEKRMMLLIATTNISRGDLLTKTQFTLQETYIDRIMPSILTDGADVIGLEAQREVAVGSMLDKRDFKAAQLVARNDEVTVVCMSGSLQVQVTGRAADNGKLHDTIAIKNEKTGEVYQATIIGKRLAVVGGTLNEAQEKLLRETH